MISSDPHLNQPVIHEGAPLSQAKASMILLHGWGATAEDILLLAYELEHPDMAFLAPQAAGNSWFPINFLAPLADNDPGLSSSLTLVGRLVGKIESAGIPPDRIIIAGFSQGACLALEFAARHARRYGGLLAYSGGLISPGGTPQEYRASLRGTPVFLGCSDVDAHIPKERIMDSARALRELGAEVTMRLYPGLGHTINQDELDHGLAMVSSLMDNIPQ